VCRRPRSWRGSGITHCGRLSRLACGVFAISVATSACASTSSLTVTPLQGQEEEQVARDRAQCDAIAAQARDRWAFVKTKVIAFIGGGVAGAAFGVALPPFGTPAAVVLCAAAVGAAVGFVLGEIVGTVAGAEEHRKSESAYLDRYVRCLNERGYQVKP